MGNKTWNYVARPQLHDGVIDLYSSMKGHGNHRFQIYTKHQFGSFPLLVKW